MLSFINYYNIERYTYMKSLILPFYISSYGDWVDTVISISTGGVYSHVELLFNDGVSFSASPRKKGTSFREA